MGLKDEIRAEILGCDDMTFDRVEVPEWGRVGEHALVLRSLSAKQRGMLLRMSMGRDDKPDPSKLYPLFVVLCVVESEENPEPVFELADRDALGEKSGIACERIARKAAPLAGLDPEVFQKSEDDARGQDE